MSLLRWERDDPFRRMERRMTNLFDKFYGDLNNSERSNIRMPTIDVHDDGKAYTVQCELPGVRKEDVNISVHEQALVVEAESKHEAEHKDENIRLSERHYGKWSRTVPFPQNVDANKVDASLHDGILKVRVPKAEESMPRRITIS